MFSTLLISILALKYGKKKRTSAINSPGSSTVSPAQSVEVPTAPSGMVPTKLAPPTPPNPAISAGSDADDSPASARTPVCRIFCMFKFLIHFILEFAREESKETEISCFQINTVISYICRQEYRKSFIIIRCFYGFNLP